MMWISRIISFYMTIYIVIIESIEEWAFRQLPQNTSWITVSSTEYVIQQQNVSLLKCVVLCAQNSNCNSVFLHLETCYGSYLFTPDTTHNSDILVYLKRPKNACNEEFVYYNGLCLFISNVTMNWADAKSYCEVKGGNLVVLDSVEKHQDTVDFIQKYYSSTAQDYYVGASDLEREGTWQWITTHAKNYFRFGKKQPNNLDQEYLGQPANCGAILISSGNLMDEICSQTKLFICEI